MNSGILARQYHAEDKEPGKCPALHRLLMESRSAREFRVLDTGPAIASNVDYFSAHVGCLSVADVCQEGLPVLDAEADDYQLQLQEWIRNQARMYPGKDQDIVLCWDLPDYLARDVATAWLADLAGCLGGSGWLHMLLATRSTIADTPGRFHLSTDADFICQRTGNQFVSHNPWNQHELTDIDSGIEVYRTVLLRNGMREYLLNYSAK